MTTATARRNPLASREHETMTLASGNDNKMLAIAQIRRDGQTQPRQGMNEDVVTDYVAALADNVRFPAVDVMFDGVNYWLFDGFHRVESHLRSGRTEIEVKVHSGTLEQAQWRSYAANQSHGLRRSTADKERAIRAALQHKASQGMSDNALAKHLGVSDKTVTKYRVEMQSASEIPKLSNRTGIDGKTYDTTNIGKRPDDLANKSYKLKVWLMGKGWAASRNSMHKRNFPVATWDEGDAYAEYEALRTAEKYERGQLTPPAQELKGDIERAQLKAELNNSAYIALFATAIRKVIRVEGGPQAQWDFLIRYDVQDIYEALLSTELRGTLSPEIYRQARRVVLDEVRAAIHQEPTAEPQAAAAPRPSVASQVIDLAERGMDAEVEATLTVKSSVDLQATEKAICNMIADLGEALTFSITIRDGEFSIYWCAPGVPVRNAVGRGETLIEAWGALVSEARESKAK